MSSSRTKRRPIATHQIERTPYRPIVRIAQRSGVNSIFDGIQTCGGFDRLLGASHT